MSWIGLIFAALACIIVGLWLVGRDQRKRAAKRRRKLADISVEGKTEKVNIWW